MTYNEVTINTPSAQMDARCEELTELGVSGFIIENEEDFHEFLDNNKQYWDYVDADLENSFAGLSRIKCYFTDDEEGQAQFAAVKSRWPDDITVKTVQDSDWENNWRDYYKPIEVGEKLVVVPEWEDVPADGRTPLILDPGLIFGTGSHPTTKMCLAALENFAGPGKRFLDLGCGSGILGIGALVLGSESCTGCDIDAKAPDVAMSNAALNGIGKDRFHVLAGDIITDASLRRELGTGYDVVLANIVSDVIIPLSAHVRTFMKPGGVFITSGIIDGREDEVKAALIKNGFTVRNHFHEEEWHCFLCD